MRFQPTSLQLFACACAGVATLGTGPASEPLRLSLADALQYSRRENQEISALKHEAEASRAAQSAQFSRFLPTLNAELNVGTSRDKDPSTNQPTPEVPREYNHYAGALVLRQSLFSGFSDYANYQAAGAEVEAQDLTLLARQQDLRRQVIEAYFEIQLDIAKIAAEEEVEKAREQQLIFSTNRFRSGFVTEVDVLRARYDLESQKPVIAGLRSDLEKKKLNFAHLVGLPLDQAFELIVSLEQAHAALANAKLPTLPEALTLALETNTTIRSLRAELQKTDYEAAAKRGSHLPKLDLVVRAESRANLREDIGTPDSQRYSGMLELNVPLFTGLSSVYERTAAAEKNAAIEARFETTKQQLLRDLNAALRDLDLSRLRTTTGESNVKLARRTVEQSTAQYKAGSTTLTTVLDAYAQLLQARKEFSQALFDGVKAVATAQNLIGVAASTELDAGQG